MREIRRARDAPVAEVPTCTDPECVFVKKGEEHTCDKCSAVATTKCACWKQYLATKPYTATNVRQAVENNLDRLFAPWMVGRPDNYSPGPDTKLLVSLGYWLTEELTRIGANEADRRTQEWKYNRLSRTFDIWETAAECLNDVLEGRVEQNRVGHRRWG